jgi:queuine tRNA-ribosyltransferase
MARLNADSNTLNRAQMLFGINQGATFEDIRVENMRQIIDLDLDGYAIGGLAVGESAVDMYRIIDCVEPHMPQNKPRYLMGVGTPLNILEAVSRGIDMFDCVMPSRNARHAHVFTWEGKRNMMNAKYQSDPLPMDTQCDCPACSSFSRAYIHHLFKAQEMLAMRLAVMHNLHFYNSLMTKIREALNEGRFLELKARLSETIDKRI